MSVSNPQLEDGFTPIANTIMEALARTRFSGYERSVLDFLFRKTYGWSKKSDLISLGQFVDATGILKPHIVRTIKRLLGRDIIHKTVAQIGNDNLVRYEFNKHFGEWKVLPKMVMTPPALPKMVIEPLPKMVPTISISTTTTKREDIVELPDSVTEAVSKIPYGEIIKRLNEKTTREFRTGDGNRDLIRARWNDGYRLADFEKVIDNMSAAWMNDPKMENFLRPATLFQSQQKFDGYLNWRATNGRNRQDSHRVDISAAKFSDSDDYARADAGGGSGGQGKERTDSEG